MTISSSLSTTLFGQTDGFPIVYLLWLAIPATILGIVYLVFQHLAVSRDFQHHERIKAIEAGLDWQDSKEAKLSERHAYQSFWIAFWLVICGCGVSFYSISKWVGPDTDIRTAIVGSMAAALASVVASVCAVVLIVKSKPNR